MPDGHFDTDILNNFCKFFDRQLHPRIFYEFSRFPYEFLPTRYLFKFFSDFKHLDYKFYLFKFFPDSEHFDYTFYLFKFSSDSKHIDYKFYQYKYILYKLCQFKVILRRAPYTGKYRRRKVVKGPAVSR